jgi:REP element-mobilizing transposase RayT
MKYNPRIHLRRSVRLKFYDYAQEGMYFITICTQNRVHFFGKIDSGIMQLSHFGEIAYQEWERLPERWPHIVLGAFQIMPNHMHGILVINRPQSMILQIPTRATTRVAPPPVGATLVPAQNVPAQNVPAQNAETQNATPTPDIPFSKTQWASRPYVGQVIGAYKSRVATACLRYHKENQAGTWLDKIWQRSFYDNIIRDERAFRNITRYIINNPARWKEDTFF